MYRTICTELWTDPAIDGLTKEGKLLFVYLITNPHTHLSGIYHLSKRSICEETKLLDRVVDTLFDTLSRLELAWWDGATKTIFVRNMFVYQGRGEKNDRAAAKHLRTLHHSSLIAKFLDRYPSVKPYYPDTLSDRVSDTPSSTCPPVPDPDSVPDPVPDPAPGRESERGIGFDQFWTIYPRKVGKGAARKAWTRQGCENGLVERICAQVVAAMRTSQWQRENGQFIPYPATWLNQRRWEDTYEAAGPSPFAQGIRDLVQGVSR